MMIIVGDALLGQGHGKYFMLAEAFTVFLALIGTTLSCMNTGARVTYAMGKDDEAPEHFGMLHAESLSPRKAIWTLAVISAVIGVVAVSLAFGDAGAPTDASIAALPHGIFSSFGYSTHDKMAALPNSLLAMTLTSNFGTFILYALSCFLCMVAYHKRPDYSFIKHTLIPGFGLLANLICMAFYVAGPFFNLGTKMEPLTALGISAIWGLYGAVYFLRSSKAKGKSVLLDFETRFVNTTSYALPLGGFSLRPLYERLGKGATQKLFKAVPNLKNGSQIDIAAAHMLDVQFGEASDFGKVRTNNEDAMASFIPSRASRRALMDFFCGCRWRRRHGPGRSRLSYRRFSPC